MNYYLITFLAFVLPYAYISIYQDIEKRKISNWINLSFLYFCFLFFCFFITQFSLIDFGVIFLSIGFGYYFYHKGIWGGADGKIFIGLLLLLFSLGNMYFYLDFLLNLALFYSLAIILFVLFRTPREDKINLLKRTDYGLHLFQILIIFLVVKNLLFHYLDKSSVYYSYLIIAIFVLVMISNPLIKRLYRWIKDSNVKFFLNLFLLFILILSSEDKVILYFFIVLFFKIFLQFVSKMTDQIKMKSGEQYYSPFSLYLFFSAIFTMIGGQNIIRIIFKFFN